MRLEGVEHALLRWMTTTLRGRVGMHVASDGPAAHPERATDGEHAHPLPMELFHPLVAGEQLFARRGARGLLLRRARSQSMLHESVLLPGSAFGRQRDPGECRGCSPRCPLCSGAGSSGGVSDPAPRPPAALPALWPSRIPWSGRIL